MTEPMNAKVDTIADVIRPALAQLDLELFDIELVGNGPSRTLRITINRADDDADIGIDMAAITAATEAVSPLLDQDPRIGQALPGSYTLEVSSPGLERPLRTPAHFRGAIGGTVSVKTRAQPHQGPALRRRGTLVAADDAGFEVEFDGARERIAYDDIVQARTVFEWGPNRPTKHARQRSGRGKKQEVAQ